MFMRDFWKPMPVSGKLIRELLLLFLLLLVQQSYAQRITRQYNNVSFSAALKDLNARQHKYTINFVYDELEDFRVTKSIGNTLVSDALGYPEILQFIIHEVDGVLMLAGIQILQRRRERHIIILSGDALG